MNHNPINLSVRFLLEIVMLIVFGYWGWHLAGNWERYVAAPAPALPVIAASLWGVFRIQNDPKPTPVEIPGIWRLLLEWVLFGLAIYFLHDLGRTKLSWIMAIIVIIHYIVSYDRTLMMLRNKAYTGFKSQTNAH